MIGDSESGPVMNHIGLEFENTESGLDMSGMISDLDLHGSNILQELDIIRLKFISILEAFRRFKVISFLFVNCSHCVPTEHTFQFALH